MKKKSIKFWLEVVKYLIGAALGYLEGSQHFIENVM